MPVAPIVKKKYAKKKPSTDSTGPSTDGVIPLQDLSSGSGGGAPSAPEGSSPPGEGGPDMFVLLSEALGLPREEAESEIHPENHLPGDSVTESVFDDLLDDKIEGMLDPSEKTLEEELADLIDGSEAYKAAVKMEMAEEKHINDAFKKTIAANSVPEYPTSEKCPEGLSGDPVQEEANVKDGVLSTLMMNKVSAAKAEAATSASAGLSLEKPVAVVEFPPELQTCFQSWIDNASYGLNVHRSARKAREDIETGYNDQLTLMAKQSSNGGMKLHCVHWGGPTSSVCSAKKLMGRSCPVTYKHGKVTTAKYPTAATFLPQSFANTPENVCELLHPAIGHMMRYGGKTSAGVRVREKVDAAGVDARLGDSGICVRCMLCPWH